MNENPFKHRRPTDQEEQAFAALRTEFAEHLKQFPVSRDVVSNLEKNLEKTAHALTAVASQTKLEGEPILTTDGAQWHGVTELSEKSFACYRQTGSGAEFAVVEHWPKTGANEVVAQGRNASEVLRSFAQEQRQVMEIWRDDVSARMNEFLSQKYPGQDMSRVAESFIQRLTHGQSYLQALSRGYQQNHSRGIRP